MRSSKLTSSKPRSSGRSSPATSSSASRSTRSPGRSASRACRRGPERRLGNVDDLGDLAQPRLHGPGGLRSSARDGAPAKPMRATRQRGGHSGRSAYEHVGPEHWLRIPVPALITEEQHALAQELLARNAACRRATRDGRRCCRGSSCAASAATPTTAAPPAARPGSSTTTTVAQERTASAAPRDASALLAPFASKRSTSWCGPRYSRCLRTPS